MFQVMYVQHVLLEKQMLLIMMQVDLILHVQQHYVLKMNMFQVMYV